MKEKTDEERIAIGECVSDRGVDHCKVCIDSCEVHGFKRALQDELEKNKIDKSKDTLN